jgi:type I restriction enzyme S subunit
MGEKLSSYPSYEPSDTPWIGHYPSAWKLTRVKFVTYVKARVGWHGLKSDDFTDEGPYLVTGSDFVGPVIEWRNCYHCDIARYDQDPYIQLQNGDLLITKDGTIGKVALVENLNGKATLNSGVFVVRPVDDSYLSAFYFWLLQSTVFTGFVDFNKTGSTIVHLYQDTFVNFKYALPSLSEQMKIVAFLDYETAKIDALISNQQRLIALLEEKRQAVISHAVTKGLDPTARLRPSGIDWLGDVPAHWEVSQFGYISEVVRGGSPRPAGDPTLFNGDYSPWVTVAEITKDDEVYLESTESCLTKKGSDQCRVFQAGTLLISNSGATLGVPKILRFDANANDGVVGFEKLRFDDRFCYHFLTTTTEHLRESIKQGSGQPNLNTDIIKKIPVALPPDDEVEAIVAFIDRTRVKFRSLLHGTQSAIALLKERRTALISAAVTGKIDLRDWQQPGEASDISTQKFDQSEEALA